MSTPSYYRRHHRKPQGSHFGSFFLLVLILGLVLILFYVVFSWWRSVRLGQRDEGVLSVESGEVFVQEWGQDTFQSAATSQVVLAGDRVKTGGGSYARIRFGNHSEFFLDQNAELYFYETTDVDDGHELRFELVRGRMAYTFKPSVTDPVFTHFRAGLIELKPLQGQGVIQFSDMLLEARVLEGQAVVTYWDRGDRDLQVDEQWLTAGQRSRFTPEIQTAFLNRENVDLVETIPNELADADGFLMWVQGGPFSSVSDPVLSSEPEIDEQEDLAFEREDLSDQPDLNLNSGSLLASHANSTQDGSGVMPLDLSLSVISPVSPFTIQEKTGVAIEGVVRGDAERITVRWSGGGSPYALSLFEPGSDQFRFVADVQYGNLQKGENRYTIQAWDADGNPSDPVTVTVRY